MGGEWSTSRPGRFTPENRRQGGPQMYTVCGVTTLHCYRVNEKAVCTCARRVLHYTGSGKFIHIQVPCYLLAAPSASPNYACPPGTKPMVPTQSLRFALEPTRHFRTYAPLPNLRATTNRFAGARRTRCIQYITQYYFSLSSLKFL